MRKVHLQKYCGGVDNFSDEPTSKKLFLWAPLVLGNELAGVWVVLVGLLVDLDAPRVHPALHGHALQKNW